VVLCCSALIINVDNTILNVALPTLVRKLHATSSELQWIVDSYALVFAGLLLVSGSLADRLGRKRFFLIGMTVFACGSIGAAFSGSVDLLIAWRAVMGVGAALTIPASLSIINDVFRDPAQRARAIGSWAATIGLGIAIGPIVGGLLLTRFWWGSVFLVNVPIAALAFAGALLLVPDSKNPAASRPDPAGALLSIVGLGLLLWAIIEAPAYGWASAQVTGAGLASLAVLGIFVAWEARSRHPMLKLSFFRDRRFSIAAAGEFLGIFGLMGALFLQTQMLQFGFGYSPLQAGLRILPVAAVLCVCAPMSPAVARVIGVKLTVAAGLMAIAGGLWQNQAVSTAAAHYAGFVPGMLLIGLGAGLLLPTSTNSVVGAVPQGEGGIGSASNAVALQVGGALGVAVIGSVLSTRYQDHMTAVLAGRHLPAAATHAILSSLGGALTVAGQAGGATGTLLAETARAAFMSGNQAALAAGAAVALGGAVLVLARLPSQPARICPGSDHGDVRRREIVAGAQHGVPGPVGERVGEAVAEIEPGRMPPLAVSPPPAHRTVGQIRIDGHDVDLRVTKESLDNVLPGRPQPGLDDDTQLDSDGGRHQADKGILKAGRKFFATRLGQDDRYGRRRIDDQAPLRRPCQRGRPVSS